MAFPEDGWEKLCVEVLKVNYILSSPQMPHWVEEAIFKTS